MESGQRPKSAYVIVVRANRSVRTVMVAVVAVAPPPSALFPERHEDREKEWLSVDVCMLGCGYTLIREKGCE